MVRLWASAVARVAPLVICLPLVAFWAQPCLAQRVEPLTFSADGHTVHGDWHADVTISRDAWLPGQELQVEARLRFPDPYQAPPVSAEWKWVRKPLPRPPTEVEYSSFVPGRAVTTRYGGSPFGLTK